MATNPYFNNFNNASEQKLLDDLIVESHQIYGHNLYYLPRVNDNYDQLYGTSDIVHFEHAYPVEMYIKSVDGFSGDGNFMAKFGLEIRDQIVFSVARTTFETLVGDTANLARPREGDLLYFPLNKKCFEIKFADNKPTFYQLGALQSYNLTCELYEYSSEKFNTGVAEIDSLFTHITETPTGAEPTFDDSEIIQNETDEFIDFTDKNPFSEGDI